ncbi:MAG: DUF1553 domain-containing protein [Rubripirellula sp.]
MKSLSKRSVATVWSSTAVCVLLVCGALDVSADQPIDFNEDIRPLLSNNCLTCHGPDEEERVAGLRLDTQDGSRADMGGYAAITPGDPESSELLLRLTTDDEDLRMPPEGKGRRFGKQEIELVRRWIKQGADYAKHWSYTKPIRPELPDLKRSDWPRNAIDHFILAKLESNGLQPSRQADRYTLARRVSLDLTGLPPTWDEAKSFADDTRENAYEAYVDQMLAKQSFGERWARVWLDLARYADSAGYADDPARTIWAYRDYVIRSMNENKPFDQFTIEQIAGDLLPDPTEENLIATAFHRNTMTNSEGGTNDEEFRNVAVVDRVNTTMAVWMGTTIACAQCHTHKYDPITHDEYFQMFAFFNNTEDTDKKDERPFIEIWSEDRQSSKDLLMKQMADLKHEIDQSTPALQAAQAEWLASEREEPKWELLIPQEATARYRELNTDQDGWVVAEGQKPVRDNYKLRFETSSSALTAIKLEVPAEQLGNFVLSQVKASWSPLQEGVKARYLRVELPGKRKMIHLAELQVFSDGKNVALKGKATQSSTDYGGVARYVNDGITDGDFAKRSVNHTSIENDPWVEIDLGASLPIEKVTLWNRTDGGVGIGSRLKGFQVSLLDEKRKVVWKEVPAELPSPSTTISPDGTVQIQFAAALADHEQTGFPAKSVIASPLDKSKGWAVAPQQGKAHVLTLIAKRPQMLSNGVLEIQLNHLSDHSKHVLDRFRLFTTKAGNVLQWAKMPEAVRNIVRGEPRELNPKQEEQLAKYYRSIAPLLAPQRKELAKLERLLSKVKPTATVPVMRELTKNRRTTNVQIRGNYQSKGNEVVEATPAAFHPLPPDAKPDRLALAQWLIADENPLTPRVIANRHWEEVFGTGIVLTSEEFGSQGDLPSHPLLLDWLAVELRESGWNLKHLLKLLVMSATYQQSSVSTEGLRQADPFNRYYASGPRFRVSAEMVRDQTLFVSGLLSDKMFGPPVKPPQPELGLKAAFGSATDWKTSAGDDRYRRGLYTSWRRSSPYPSMAQFDAPNREVCTVRRIRTNTPLQALVTLNDPVYVEAAQSLARKMIDSGSDRRTRIEFAFQRCLIRNPTEAEVQRLSDLVDVLHKQYLGQLDEAKKMATDPLGELPEQTDVAEYAAWTVVGNVILNLDEMLMKR